MKPVFPLAAAVAGMLAVPALAAPPITINTSAAGLRTATLYVDADELAECLSLLAEHPEVGPRLAAPGREYVLERYRWEPVLDRVERCLAAWTRP